MTVTFALLVSDGAAMRCVHPPALPPALAAAIEDHIAASMVEPSRHPAMDAQEAMRPRAVALAPPVRALVTTQVAPPHTPAPSDEIRRQAIARAARDQGFSGDICDQCGGSHMKRSGTCLTCRSCGSTTGCS